MKKNCSVCGLSVGMDKNVFQKHDNKSGKLCYGSFSPAEFNPFKVHKTKTGLGFPGEDALGLDAPEMYMPLHPDFVAAEVSRRWSLGQYGPHIVSRVDSSDTPEIGTPDESIPKPKKKRKSPINT